MPKLKLGAIVGSNRRDSINRKLAQPLTQLAAADLTAHFIAIDDRPMYNQDLEQPVSDKLAHFKSEIAQADALLFVTPEQSRSIPAVLKNVFDWPSCPWGQSSWSGKPKASIGTSGNAISTAVGQHHLRSSGVGLHLIGGGAYINFKPDLVVGAGNVTDKSVRAFLKGFMTEFVACAGRFAARQAAA